MDETMGTGSDVTHFRGVQPPENRAFSPPPSKASPGGLILNALAPLRNELDMALARGDREAALQMAYGALSAVADALAAHRGDRVQPGQVLVHALFVELAPLPLELRSDGTLVEPGTSVQVSYRNWAVGTMESQRYAQSLAERFRSLWPGAWLILQGMAQRTGGGTEGRGTKAAEVRR
jgi:hypothetical protein